MNDNFNAYELVGSYFTAGENSPTYLAVDTPKGWVISKTSYEVLKKGKTFPMMIRHVFAAPDGYEYLITSPHFNSKIKMNVAAAFRRNPETVAAIMPNLVTSPGSSYYTAPKPGFFEGLGKNVKLFLFLGLGAWVAVNYFRSRGQK